MDLTLTSPPIAMALILASKGFGGYFRQHFLDKTFQGLYQANAFDLGLLIPYFIVLIILAGYGAHRYWLVYLYYKNKKNKTTEPSAYFPTESLPRITVQLPIFNEQYVVDRLLDSVCRLDYPREKLDIQLLDDSTDETVEVARLLVERYAALGHPVTYLHRDNREGYKAGALAEGLKTAKGEFIAIFDADFVPPPDFLMNCIHHFTDQKIGMVQTRWTHINRNYSLLTQVEAILLDGHFVLEHSGRSRSGVFFNFNGTAGMWRRRAIDEAGGWQHDTLTEDTDLSYRAQLVGWRFLYLPDVECASELPVEMNAFKAQQARWAKGLMQTAIKILPRMLRSNEPSNIKAEAVFHLTANISYPFMVILATLLLPAMIVRFYQGWFQMLFIDLPLFIASSCSISGFYLTSQRVLYPKTWKRSILYMPLVMAVGIGLSVRNAKAVLEALLGVKSEFVRTPKFKIEGHSGTWKKKSYRNRAGWMPYLEIALGLYFISAIVYSIQNENYATAPFLFLFVWGFLYTGVMSVAQGWIERLRFGVQPNAASAEARASPPRAPGF